MIAQGFTDNAAVRALAAAKGALCTIVTIEGSYSRRIGAQLAVLADGSIVGSLADGCLESQLARKSVVVGRSMSGRVDHGGRRIIKNKQTTPLYYVNLKY